MSGRRQSTAGFTLLELVVVMGLLAAFCVMLVQLLTTGVRLFDEGEDGQALADRAGDASRLVRQQWTELLGPLGAAPEVAVSRLLVQWVPLGWNASEPGQTQVQMLRGLVPIDAGQERALVERQLAWELSATDRELDPELAQISRGGRARVWLLPWPAGDPDGAYLQLRRGLFLPAEPIAIGDDWIDPTQIADLQAEIGAELMETLTRPILHGLLHVEFALWSQDTTGWTGEPGSGGPERAWDSARAGWLLDPEQPARAFTLDLGPQSLTDPTDDVFPRWVRVTLVVGRGEERPAVGLLAERLGPREQRLALVNPDRFPRRDTGGFVKIGPEWIAYGRRQGNHLIGLRRGQRGTAAAAHRVGARVRVGRTVTFTVRLHCGRESWNG